MYLHQVKTKGSELIQFGICPPPWERQVLIGFYRYANYLNISGFRAAIPSLLVYSSDSPPGWDGSVDRSLLRPPPRSSLGPIRVVMNRSTGPTSPFVDLVCYAKRSRGLYCPWHSQRPCMQQDEVLSLSWTARQELFEKVILTPPSSYTDTYVLYVRRVQLYDGTLLAT